MTKEQALEAAREVYNLALGNDREAPIARKKLDGRVTEKIAERLLTLTTEPS